MPFAVSLGAPLFRIQLDPLVFGWLLVLGIAEFLVLRQIASSGSVAKGVSIAMAIRLPALLLVFLFSAWLGPNISDRTTAAGDVFGTLMVPMQRTDGVDPVSLGIVMMVGGLVISKIGLEVIPANLPIDQENGARSRLLKLNFVVASMVMLVAVIGAQGTLWIRPHGVAGG